jgi:ring-1,2-phenylacetyl-CoA epoxidase subunit PaaE
MAEFYPLRVQHIQKLTPTSVAITLEIPKDLIQSFIFVPGQYITIKKELKGEELRRSYSISSSPKKDSITIGVKRIDKGGFSDYANSKLTENDILEVMPPQGKFVYNPSDTPQHIAAFAAGSGITPIMSIARSVLDSHPKNKFLLVYGNKSYEETMFYTDLVKLQLEYADRFFLYFTLSQSQEAKTLFGRIDTSTINYALKNKHKDIVFDDYFLCGPEPLIHLVKNHLLESGIAEDNIHFELFTTTEIKEELPVSVDGSTQVYINLDEEEFSLTMDKRTKILDAALKEQIDAPYSCQGGVCSTCIAKITEGSALMEKNQILTDDEIADGFILTCQAHPTSPLLRIDYDDV